jgi:hypothetical protein
MDVKEYRAKARLYVKQNGRKTPAEIYKAIGRPPDGYRLKADGKGSVTTETIASRKGRKNRAESKRQTAIKLRPPQTKEEANRNRRQEYARRKINLTSKQGQVVIDHKIDLSLLHSTVEGQTPQQAQQTIQRLEQSYGPLGNRPDNRQIIGARTNEIKRQQTKAVQSKLQQMESRNPSRKGKSKFKQVRGAIRYGLEGLTGGYTGANSMPVRVEMDPFFSGATFMIP